LIQLKLDESASACGSQGISPGIAAEHFPLARVGQLVSWEQHAKMLAAELEAVPLVFQNRKVLT